MKRTGIIFGVIALADAAIWALTRSTGGVCTRLALLPAARCDLLFHDLHSALGPLAPVAAALAIALVMASTRKRRRLPPCPLCGYPGGVHRCSSAPLQ